MYFKILLLNLIFIISINASDLDLKGPPFISLDRTGHQKSINSGKDARLNCPITGNPQPIFEWIKGDKAIPEEGWDRFRVQGNTLRIKQVRPDDAAIYICTGVNGFGSVQYAISVEVLDALGKIHVGISGNRPRILEVYPVTGTVITKQFGQSSIFKCQVSGDPQPEITWFKNGQELRPYDTLSQSRMQMTSHSLLLEELQLSDAGNYTCVAVNKYGATTANWTLNVIEGSSAVSAGSYPLEVRDEVVEEGDKAVLHCKGTWDREFKPKVMWLRHIQSSSVGLYLKNETLQYKGNHYRVLAPSYFKIHDGFFITKYIINEVDRSDSGIYVCTATTKFAFNFRQVQLSVLDTPAMKPSILLIVGLSSIIVLVIIIVVVATIRRRKPKNNRQAQSNRSLLPDMKNSYDQRLIINPIPSSKISSHASSGRHSVAPESGPRYPMNPLCSQHIGAGQPVIIYQDANSTPSVYVASTGSPAPNDLKYQHLDVV